MELCVGEGARPTVPGCNVGGQTTRCRRSSDRGMHNTDGYSAAPRGRTPALSVLSILEAVPQYNNAVS